MAARGDDDHEVRGRAPWSPGAFDLPVGEVRRPHHDGNARARHVELDEVVARSHPGHANVRERALGYGPCRPRRRVAPRRRPPVGQRPVEGFGIVEPRHGGALPRAELGGPPRVGRRRRTPLAPPVGIGAHPVDHDGFVRESLDERGARDFVDGPSRRRLLVEVGHGCHGPERGVRVRALLGFGGHRRVVADPEVLQVAHPEVEVRRDRAIGQTPDRVRGGERERRRGHEVVRRGAGRLVVQALHRGDAPVSPVGQQHERQRRPVRVEAAPPFPEEPARGKGGDRVDEALVLGPGLCRHRNVGRRATLEARVVVLRPVREVLSRLVDPHERPGCHEQRERCSGDDPHESGARAVTVGGHDALLGLVRRGAFDGWLRRGAVGDPDHATGGQPHQLGRAQTGEKV